MLKNLCRIRRVASYRSASEFICGAGGEIYGPDHIALQESLEKIIENDINPHCAEWEKAKAYPAHEVMKLLGEAGFLGTSHPEEYGGMGLDYSYTVAVSETLGKIKSGGVSLSIGVQFEMATPALAKFGSEHVCEEFLRPAIMGDQVACIGVSGAGSITFCTQNVALNTEVVKC